MAARVSIATIATGLALFSLIFVSLGLHAAPPGTHDQIGERLMRAGEICLEGDECGVAAAAVAAGGRSGQEVYDSFCFACHATGVSEAPILGDNEAWNSRLAKGMDALWQTTLAGINLMPAKGSCVNCTDDELRDALDYMLASVLSE
ncbi:MAG: c-type cytochrome [Gammaproteobacteria bacterium]|nr:c-type cytochrome [Gammaproteobacteria bacterium]MCY4198432.1 c-type cytochrome [Gammaproteobacteria bacterium]MCY4324074.1 c-type cytochrome [Gammaproteobacteria bacterium]